MARDDTGSTRPAPALSHYAFGREPHPGNELDCGSCRVLLLEAFRPPADVPEPVQPELPGGCLEPELCTAADPCPVCEAPEPEPEPEQESWTVRDVRHRTEYLIGTSPDGVSGAWSVTCRCGFIRTDVYGPGRRFPDKDSAGRACLRWVHHHQQNPEEK